MIGSIKSLRMKWRVKTIKCRCGDPGCPCCQGSCRRMATSNVYRTDMEDRTGTPLCEGCATDAYYSGFFTGRPIAVQLNPKFRSASVDQLVQAAESDAGALPILADALEEQGYSNRGILRRLRERDFTALQYLHVKSFGSGANINALIRNADRMDETTDLVLADALEEMGDPLANEWRTLTERMYAWDKAHDKQVHHRNPHWDDYYRVWKEIVEKYL